MKSTALVIIFCFVLFSAQSQTSTKEAIVGCWQPQSVKCEDANAYVQESDAELKSQQFCFDSDGKFRVL